MHLSAADLAIITGYMALIVMVGAWVSRRANQGLRSYFLAGNRLPWYALGLSNASAMFDVAGTLWLVSILFVYGLKSIWLPWLWPVFNQIFLMAFLSVWLRRAGVMTGAEWISLRFGNDRSAHLSHIIVVAFALIMVLAYVAYGFVGIGKLVAQLMPWNLADLLHLDVFLPRSLHGVLVDPGALDERRRLLAEYNERAYGVGIVCFTAAYVIAGGMFSVVLTEVIQFLVMSIACVAIAAIAMTHTTPAQIAQATPAGWDNPFFGWKLNLDWSNLLPSANQKIAREGYSLFSLFFMLALFKGILASLAGPAPNYDMQRILSTRSPSEAAKMSFLVSVVLNPPRYLMIAGLTVLSLVYFSGRLRAMGGAADYEALLPLTLVQFLPSGLLGLTLAGLLAASMSTFAAPLNAAPAYVVNDLYRKYVNPHASEKKLLALGYAVTVLFVIGGVSYGLFLHSIDSILNWITAGLYGAYTSANVAKWYWWRINGWGYFWGMSAGVACALVLGVPEFHLNALYTFPLMFALCTIALFAGSLATKPTPMAVLKPFYLRTRPWGFWGPVHAALAADGRKIAANGDFWRDAGNVVVGVVWQTALVAAPIFLVIRHWTAFFVCAGLVAVASIYLKVFWYDRLRDYPDDLAPEERQNV